MSRYCGKCDFCDHIIGMNDEHLKKINVYVNGKKVKADTEKYRALYYPFIIGLGVHDANGDSVWLSQTSNITQEESERLDYFLKTIKRAYNRCKRQKIPFTYERAIETIYTPDCVSDYYLKEPLNELFERVCKSPHKADASGIRIEGGIIAYYRSEWEKELIRVGWEENEARKWVYEH